MSERTVGLLFVAAATVLWSTAGFFVRLIDLDVWTTLGWRSLFGAAALGLILLRQRRTAGSAPASTAFGWVGWLAVLFSAVSMLGYIAALKLTSVANVLSIYATVPFVAAGIAFLWMGERPERRVVVASLVAMIGVLVVVGFSTGAGDLAGNATAFLMTASFAALLVMARRYPALGMVKVNALGALACVLVCLPLMSDIVPGAYDLAILALFGVICTGLAYVLFLTGGRRVPSGEAGLIALLDIVLGPLWVFLAFSENPGAPTIVGGAVILSSVAWYLWAGHRQRGLVVSA
ncbi:MAG: DMT family transporter [Rhizobiaceae bacterium]|nr:DMT family transporter [Rhizobiaceae bacterium]